MKQFKALELEPVYKSQNIEAINQWLEAQTAIRRVEWASKHLDGAFVLSSSFGVQSAVMLHMITQFKPNIPVILTDTGYLYPETYQFIDELTHRLNLNLHVHRATESSAWQEARYGKLWEKGLEGLQRYNQLNKVEPMQRALRQLKAKTWFVGLRRTQSSMRKDLGVLQAVGDQVKVYPIINWSNKDVHYYLQEYKLPYHPLWEKGYTSIGDWHSTRPQTIGMDESATRFQGVKRECGLHEFGDGI